MLLIFFFFFPCWVTVWLGRCASGCMFVLHCSLTESTGLVHFVLFVCVCVTSAITWWMSMFVLYSGSLSLRHIGAALQLAICL